LQEQGVKREMRKAVIAIFVRVRGKKGNERGYHGHFYKSRGRKGK